ncbi:MAG: tripartite tricarboxylate transporter substrate binding protein [Hyphomicrobium sp.]|nr:tripartite tricarboxylate transporter substrate binding protein [Hyphomicrobium sp.]
MITRVIAQKLSEKLGGQFFIDNVTAGGGNVAMGGVAKAVGDGYTLLIVSSHFVVNPSLIPDTPYDPVKDFAPITLMAVASQVVVVNPSVPANNMKELVALIRANPGKYNYASPGTGTTGHLAGEMFRLAMGLDLVHVPFKGAAPAIQSTVAGHTPIAFVGLPSAAVQMKDGKVRALAITTAHRSPAFPDLVTMAQAGFANQESDVMQGLLAPAGTPKEIVNLLQRTVAEIVTMPDVKARLAAFGFDPVANKPEEFAARIKEESARWAKVIKDANIKMTQ